MGVSPIDCIVSLVVERLPSKQGVWVRFPHVAHYLLLSSSLLAGDSQITHDDLNNMGTGFVVLMATR